ncbi:hypothetical protein GCM10011534_27250 [Pseudooceanicola nanhaiensis]|uniref:DUF2927 domain-containing protein n=1 Tax=Pseudooceanicola nanhaiensis TaxID=375761 RepID=A0A917SXZ8_9RHOB|nr:hypothetical protein GCM10011534_27250 [Pseudooceanicola nanhaiensis]
MGGFRTFLTGLAVTALLAGCEQGLQTSLTPKARPVVLPKPVEERPKPSARSEELTRYYAGVQADLLAQGLLRQDGGGIDTPFNTRQLAENFERIALYDEYARGAGLRTASDAPSHLRRWVLPVRVNVEFGDTVPEEIRATDSAYIADYAARLGRLTGHPVTMARGASANFHVLVMGEDDRGPAIRRIRQLVPNISDSSVDIFRTLPRSIHCLVVAFSGGSSDYEYRKAIAFVRAEHPDLMRRSCYHEEMAQGLGLANDSPNARPSIFNDDDEFALLTTHDELLLRMLYDTRLSTGMTPAQARPIVQEIAEGLSGGPS